MRGPNKIFCPFIFQNGPNILFGPLISENSNIMPPLYYYIDILNFKPSIRTPFAKNEPKQGSNPENLKFHRFIYHRWTYNPSKPSKNSKLWTHKLGSTKQWCCVQCPKSKQTGFYTVHIWVLSISTYYTVLLFHSSLYCYEKLVRVFFGHLAFACSCAIAAASFTPALLSTYLSTPSSTVGSTTNNYFYSIQLSVHSCKYIFHREPRRSFLLFLSLNITQIAFSNLSWCLNYTLCI